ncbi:hypothetical protein LXL04_039580 [Taraxacum kok-saghyz]
MPSGGGGASRERSWYGSRYGSLVDIVVRCICESSTSKYSPYKLEDFSDQVINEIVKYIHVRLWLSAVWRTRILVSEIAKCELRTKNLGNAGDSNFIEDVRGRFPLQKLDEDDDDGIVQYLWALDPIRSVIQASHSIEHLIPPTSSVRFLLTFSPNLILLTLSIFYIESRSFENSYIPENLRTPKPLTFSKNRLRGAKNRSILSPVAKKNFRKNNFFFSKTLHMGKFFFLPICTSLYNTYLKGFVKKILKKNAKKKSCIYAKKKKKKSFFRKFFQRILIIMNVLESPEVGFLKGITKESYNLMICTFFPSKTEED